jgi:SNF2 family DNA or RNA helicase
MQWIRAERRLLLTATPLPNARISEFNALLKALGCRIQLRRTGTGMATAGGAAAAAPVVDEETRSMIVRRFFIQSDIPASHSRPPLRTEVIRLDFDTPQEANDYHNLVASFAEQAAARAAEIAARRASKDEVQEEEEEGEQYGVPAFQTLAAITILRGMCLSPLIIMPPEEQERIRRYHPDRPALTKIRAILQYVETRMEEDEKALVFAGRLQALEELSHHLGRAGISHAILHGKVPEQEALALIAEFAQEGLNGPRLLLMTNVGVAGLNGLERANHTLVFEPDWSPGTEDQLSGRTNRPGQKRKHLYMVKFVLKGTVEEDVHTVNLNKDRGQAAMLRLRGDPSI